QRGPLRSGLVCSARLRPEAGTTVWLHDRPCRDLAAHADPPLSVKVVYLLRNPGIASRTPAGWRSAVINAGPSGKYSEEDLREVEDADVLVVGLEPVHETVLARARRLTFIQRLGRGYENIDFEAAGRRGIPVSGMPDFNAAAV